MICPTTNSGIEPGMGTPSHPCTTISSESWAATRTTRPLAQILARQNAGGDRGPAGGGAGDVWPGAGPGHDADRGRRGAGRLHRHGEAAVESRPAAARGETGRPAP